MSTSDSGPRKRFKDKKRKKGSIGDLNLPSHLQPETGHKKFALDETIHMQKDVHVGGNILSKLVFISVLLLLGVSLMYILNQNSTPEGTDNSSSSSITPWLTNLLNGNYFLGSEKEQQNDDIEPEEISEHHYWDYLFPFLSFIQRTYEEPENLEKYSAEEVEDRKDGSEATSEQFEYENSDRDDENGEETMPEDEKDSKDEEEDDDDDDENEPKTYDYNSGDDRNAPEEDQEDDEDEAKTGVDDFNDSGAHNSYKFDSFKYDNEDESGDQDDRFEESSDGKDETSEEECNENAQCNVEGALDKDDNENDDENDDGPNDSGERETNDQPLDEDDETNPSSPVKNDREESSDSLNEDSTENDDVDEQDREAAKDEDTAEPSHVITKLGVGVALIFVAYTVIIRKWNNYVIEEQFTDIPEHETLSDQQLPLPRDDVNRNINETVLEYLDTPSASESENELSYSPDPAHEGDSESYTGTSGSDVIDSDVEPSATFDRYASSYGRANVTNEYDWRRKDELDDADEDFDRGKLDNALEKYEKILQNAPNSVRAKYGIARVLDRKAEMMRSNKILTSAIDAYEEVLNTADVPNSLFKSVANRVSDRMQFKGEYGRSIRIQRMMIERFPDDLSAQNDLVVTLLTLNRMSEAETRLEEILRRWPDDGLALVYYGFALKMKGDLAEAVDFLSRGINTREPGTQDGRFYYHLGDALQKLKRETEAMQVYEEGVAKGVFPSKYQRSLYNVDRLTARPWWSSEQSTYSSFFKKLEANWLTVRDEAVKLLKSQKKSLFREEAEQLREVGDWKQLELFSRGVKSPHCDRVPFTCRVIQDFQPASGCRRGQVKFSLMEPGTHVWPHCGPTNCRLRAHLGLVVPANVWIRVANETRTWKEGKVLLFDDSFEHEVWHNGTTYRLVLIVDLWHPELTERERRTLSAI